MIINKSNYIGIGYFLKSRRKKLNISKEILANYLCINVEQIDKWENENLENMGLKEMRKLSRILNHCPSIFIKGVPEIAYVKWDDFINQEFIRNNQGS